MDKENKISELKIWNRNQSFLKFLDKNKEEKLKLKSKLEKIPFFASSKPANPKPAPKRVRFSKATHLRQIPSRNSISMRKSHSSIQSESRISLKEILYRDSTFAPVHLPSSPKGTRRLRKARLGWSGP